MTVIERRTWIDRGLALLALTATFLGFYILDNQNDRTVDCMLTNFSNQTHNSSLRSELNTRYGDATQKRQDAIEALVVGVAGLSELPEGQQETAGAALYTKFLKDRGAALDEIAEVNTARRENPIPVFTAKACD